MEPSPWAPRRVGGGQHFKKAVTDVVTVELICFLCCYKDNDDAYTSVNGCMQKC